MGIGNYFGVNYGQHYQCGQSQSYQSNCGSSHSSGWCGTPSPSYGCEPSYTQGWCGTPPPRKGYGYNPFNMFLSMMRRFFGSQGGYPTPTPKPAYFEGPGVGKIIAGPGEGPGVGKLVAGPGEGTAGWNTMAVHQAMANAFME